VIFSLPKLICQTSCRPKNMSLFYGDTEESLKNRKDFLSRLNIDHEALVCAHQVHGDRVNYVGLDDKGKGALAYEDSIRNTDALITDVPNLPLAIFTADCLAVFLYDPVNHCLGLVHAGWRGTKEKIVYKTVQAMRGKFKTRPKDLLAGMGPCIRKCCYKVGEDFQGHFSEGLIRKNHRLYLDLPGINRGQLREAGLMGSNIIDSSLCTSCKNNLYFSFRKEGEKAGRMMSVAMLK